MNGSPPSVPLQAARRSGRVRGLPAGLSHPLPAFTARNPSALLSVSGPNAGQCVGDTEPPWTWECLGETCCASCCGTCLAVSPSRFSRLALGLLQALLEVNLQRVSVQAHAWQSIRKARLQGWRPPVVVPHVGGLVAVQVLGHAQVPRDGGGRDQLVLELGQVLERGRCRRRGSQVQSGGDFHLTRDRFVEDVR